MTESDLIVISEEIQSKVREVFEDHFKSKEIEISYCLGTKKGDNYIGIIYGATGALNRSQNNNDNDERKKNLIVKVAPSNVLRREQFKSRLCFLREIKMYTEVLTMFRDFQESRGIVPDEDGFHEYADCFECIHSEANETLVLEDLRDEQFLMYDRLIELPIEQVLLVMKVIGKFHALSFALKVSGPWRWRFATDLWNNF